MNFFNKIWKGILDNLRTVIYVGVAGFLVTIGTMAYKSTDFYTLTQRLPEFETKLKYVVDYINEEKKDIEKKKNDIAIGIRYNVTLKKFYWRDADREYRPIHTDEIGTFYRNDHDRKVYIKFDTQ